MLSRSEWEPMWHPLRYARTNMATKWITMISVIRNEMNHLMVLESRMVQVDEVLVFESGGEGET